MLIKSDEEYKKAEAASAKSMRRVLQWTFNRAASRADDQFREGYVRTPEYQRLQNTLREVPGGILAVVGMQGVGKTAALRQSYLDLNPPEHNDIYDLDSLLIPWGDKHEQIRAITNSDNEFFAYHAGHNRDCFLELRQAYRRALLAELKKGYCTIKPKGTKLPANADDLNIEWTEKILGKPKCETLREEVWFNHISRRRIILIDLPDYARTDKRLATRHLNEIYWLWIKLANLEKPPTLVIAIQKDLMRGHFFFDKMEKIELRPLSTDQLLTSYEETFRSTYPFEETALLTLASRSRGNYRRFKRYVAIAIESWPRNPPVTRITDDHVRRVISTERVAEDLDVELEQIFPKNIDSRQEAVRILLYLSDSGPREQGELARVLEIPEYTMSRLLSKLELHRYIARKARGLQKIVSLV